MNCKQINNISFSLILEKIGAKIKKTTSKRDWYFSPFRDERTASFIVNLESNIYHDFGDKSRGTVIDFWCKYKSCDVKTAIRELSLILSSYSEQKHILKPELKSKSNKKPTSKIIIYEVRPLFINILKNYLIAHRGLSERVFPYVKEVHFEIVGRKNFAIGFMNDKGGFEIRNKRFQACSSKAISSIIKDNSTSLCVFEGFIDYLSYIDKTLENKNSDEREMYEKLNESFIVLNSLSMIQNAKPYFDNYEEVKLFLDNDPAGKDVTKEVITEFTNAVDYSITYKDFNDYNDYHVASKCKLKNVPTSAESLQP